MPSVKELTDLIDNPSPDDVTFITRAYEVAEKAHEGHVRYSGEPFFIHVFETAKNLAELGMGPKTIAAGLLHDSIEDTTLTAEDIERDFGDEVLRLVEGVTKLGTLKYRGLKRHTESLRKLFVAIAEDIRVLIVKLCDRLHNMQTLSHVPEHKRRRIAEETLEIYAPLAYRLGMRRLNRELEDLAFPYVYPAEYERVKKLMKQKRVETEEHLEKVYKSIKKALAKEGMVNVTTDYRLKGFYSLWRKLERKGMDIEKVYDISAIRVIVPSVSDCYKALGVIHSNWRPLPGRIKDYIAFPKPNGYQGLHTTIFMGDGGVTEVQIRTPKMHREAEFGIASHFIYKSGMEKKGMPASSLSRIAQFVPYFGWLRRSNKDRVVAAEIDTAANEQRLNVPAWVRELAAAQEELAEPEEFLSNLKGDFFEQRVFVFSPKGDVVDLPIDSSPIDFAYAIHSKIGEHVNGAKVNGKLVSFDTKLQNGDIVEIITKAGSYPKAKWLEVAKTNLARRKIRHALAKDPRREK
jgi:guanosine-3',5'-bis(diphosphate) 3'-pyrophosphohydrolase